MIGIRLACRSDFNQNLRFLLVILSKVGILVSSLQLLARPVLLVLALTLCAWLLLVLC